MNKNLLKNVSRFDSFQNFMTLSQMIDKNAAKALDSDEFLNIDCQLLCSVLDRDTLCIREVRLFVSVLKWAKADQRKQYNGDLPKESAILAPVLPHIRFPQMSIEEFAEVVVPSGVLEDSKVVQMFLWFVLHAKPTVPYSIRPRCYLHAVEEVVRRFGDVDQRWDYRGTSDRIR